MTNANWLGMQLIGFQAIDLEFKLSSNSYIIQDKLKEKRGGNIYLLELSLHLSISQRFGVGSGMQNDPKK